MHAVFGFTPRCDVTETALRTGKGLGQRSNLFLEDRELFERRQQLLLKLLGIRIQVMRRVPAVAMNWWR